MATLNMVAPLEVGIAVRDLSLMRRFYEGVLGLSFVNQVTVPEEKSRQAALGSEGYTVARLQTPYGERIKLFAPANPPLAKAIPEYVFDEPNASYVTFIVDDINSLLEKMKAAGVSFMTGERRVEVRPETFLAFCRDPEGNVLEIVQYGDIANYRPDIFGESTST